MCNDGIACLTCDHGIAQEAERKGKGKGKVEPHGHDQQPNGA